MAYFVKLMNGSVFEITEEERNNMLGKNGMLHFASCDRTINSASITEIVSAKDYEMDKVLEKQKSQKEGVLHDGTLAFKHFGIWYWQGKDGTEYLADPAEYPEVARDCVPSKLEWEQKYKQIPENTERLKAILGTFQNVIERTGKNEPKAIGGNDFKRFQPQ